MTKVSRSYLYAAAAILVCAACALTIVLGSGIVGLLPAPVQPKPDFNATLQVLISTASALTATPAGAALPTVSPAPGDQPPGHIVWTCQLFKFQSNEQICIINADGSGFRRLTTEDGVRHYYPSLAPDGHSVLYSQYREDNVYEIYELNLADGSAQRLTDRLGALTGPEISPDGKSIAFMRWTPASDQDQLWLMNRDGSDPRRVVGGTGWDPTWSPDGSQILFASDRGGSIQLYAVKVNGTGLRQISHLPAIRGRSDWSSQNQITTYSGGAWQREIYVMNADGSDARRVSPPGGNSQGPSFSPDGVWIAFTAYFDHPKDDNGCEIYLMRTDGSDLRRLTNNDYCDYQPRWGP